MPLLKRLSDSFWTFVSPVKTESDPQTYQQRAPRTAPPRRYTRPAASDQSLTLDSHVRARRSMSPVQRVVKWSVGRKRQNDDVESPTFDSRRRKLTDTRFESRLGNSNTVVGFTTREITQPAAGSVVSEEQYGSDEAEDNIAVARSQRKHDEAGSNDEIIVKSGGSSVGRQGLSFDDDGNNIPMLSPRHGTPFASGDEVDEGTTLIVSDTEYTRDSPKRKQVISLPTAQAVCGVSVPDLQAAGWDDDNIVLRQKIAMRGYEPLLPAYHKFEFRWLPDELFSADNNAFLDSCNGNNFHASKALERLFELGARARDCATVACTSTRPDQRIRKMIEEYSRWADADAGLYPHTSAPLFIIVNKRAGHPVLSMKRRARQKLETLAARHRAALTVTRSIEPASPLSATSSELKHLIHPLPTLYAFVTSSTILSLSAWRPSEPQMDIKPIAVFKLALSDYDVWNALAVAIVVVHLRNLRLRIAEQMGLEMATKDRQGGTGDEEEEDPDR